MNFNDLDTLIERLDNNPSRAQWLAIWRRQEELQDEIWREILPDADDSYIEEE